jgi:HEAT repeat protein
MEFPGIRRNFTDEDHYTLADLDKPVSKKAKRFSEDMIGDCLEIMESGDIEDLFEIIPRIGVLRDSRFNEPLLALLFHEDIKRREFAAYSMGAIGNRSFLEPLKKAFAKARQLKGFGARELQIAIIEAIGSIGDDAAVDFFLPALKSCCATKASSEGKSARSAGRMSQWIIESLGAIAQQGGGRSLDALTELVTHDDPEIQAQALSELSVAYWHRPNEVSDSILQKIYELTTHHETIVAESALAALQNLADVGCRRAEAFFSSTEEDQE